MKRFVNWFINTAVLWFCSADSVEDDFTDDYVIADLVNDSDEFEWGFMR